MNVDRPKLLFLIGAVAPLNSTNANLMMKVINRLSEKSDIYTLSVGAYNDNQLGKDTGPCTRFAKYSTVTHSFHSDYEKIDLSKITKYRYQLVSRLIDHNGYQDAYDGFLLRDIVERLDSMYRFDGICTSMEPYKCAFALSKVNTAAKKILYVIDPPAEVVPGLENACTPFRKATGRTIISRSDMLITTHRILDALKRNHYDLARPAIVSEEFPLFSPLSYNPEAAVLPFDPDKINLFYCGWLRHEAFLLNVIENLDERFAITFVGNDNERIANVNTKASVRLFPAVSRDIAVNSMLRADVLVCIGNTYPVHIPSKIFDYISSGKPFVNLYTLSDCPTLEYANQYPAALNVSVDQDPVSAAAEIIAFCQDNRSKFVSSDHLLELYQSIDSFRILENISTSIIREVSV